MSKNLFSDGGIGFDVFSLMPLSILKHGAQKEGEVSLGVFSIH